MPDERGDTTTTKDDRGSPLVRMIGAIVVVIVVILGIWFFATQTYQGDTGPNRGTVEIYPGG